MKIIFLDIDGVLSTINTRYNYFESDCVNRLNTILDATAAKIVISSTWRKGRTLQQLQKLFITQGDKRKIVKNPISIDPSTIIGVTPDFNTLEEQDFRIKLNDDMLFGRGLEICAWLEASIKSNITIESYAVLDDDVADIAPHLHRHIKTHTHYGLNDEDVLKTIQILDRKVSNEDVISKLY